MTLIDYCVSKKFSQYKVVGKNGGSLNLPQVEVTEKEEWLCPSDITDGLRSSLYADHLGRMIASRSGRHSFIWNNGDPYIVILGWFQGG